MEPATMTLMLSLAQMAGGIGLQLFQNQDQRKLTKMGYEINNAAIAANMSLAQAQSERIAADNLRSLRQSIGAQVAISGARNQMPSGQDAARLFKSEGRFARDERVRQLNLLTKMSDLKGGGLRSHIEMMTSESRRSAQFWSGTIDAIPVTAIADYYRTPKVPASTPAVSVQSSIMQEV